jgi:hypothetical protein
MADASISTRVHASPGSGQPLDVHDVLRSPGHPLDAETRAFMEPRWGVLQRKCACGNHTVAGGECVECGKKGGTRLQRSTVSNQPINRVPPIVHDVLRSPGHPLDAETRAFMEPRFGHDFSQVRIHTDDKAAESAWAVNALAYTVGRDIVFGSGQVASDTRQGRALIAHELAHVVQQSQSVAPDTPQFFGGDEHGPAETEANRTADRIIGGEPAGMLSAQPGPLLHRKVNVDKPKDLIANPTGKGLVQTNAQTVEGYLQTLCSGGTVSVNKGSGAVSLAAGFCPTPMPAGFMGPPAPAPADKSKEPTGCNCLCDMVGSANDYTIVVDDKDWPHTLGRVVTTPSPNSPKLWGAATVSGKAMTIDPWLVLGHEFCGHAWLAEKGLPDINATRGEGGHQETVDRENELRKEHGIEARGNFKDPYCGESFWQDKAGPGPVEWSSYLKICEAWRKKTYGGKYKISDKIP